MSLLDVCQRTARRTFGIERLRPEQESAMVAILEGRDALVALPTGFVKVADLSSSSDDPRTADDRRLTTHCPHGGPGARA